MSRPASPFDRWGSVIWERQSRHSGLNVTVVARRQGGQPFLAYLHTADRTRVLAVSEGRSPEKAAHRVENVFDEARARIDPSSPA